MEFILGSIVTLFGIFIVLNRVSKAVKHYKIPLKIKYSQSQLHQIMLPIQMMGEMVKEVQNTARKTQSRTHFDSLHVKVVIDQDKAYWIKDNIFYVADRIGNHVDHETARRVDTMGMNDVELKKISEIVEILREEDTNDRGRSRDKGI